MPNVNRLAEAVRKAGGKVVWIQNLAPWESEASWSVAREMYAPDKAKKRWESMQRDAHGFQLWPGLDVRDGDERVVKRRYSAFIQGSSNIENVLKDNGIKTLIVTGVGDQRVLRIDRARRDDAQLSIAHGVGRLRDRDRRRACRDDGQFLPLLRRRAVDRRDHRPAENLGAAQG